MNWKNKKVFISGGAGVIGKELVSLLSKAGAIIMVGDLKPKPVNFPKNILYLRGDLNYLEKKELDQFKPEVFFHLAATFERSDETYEFWDENFQHNLKLSHHLMSLFKEQSSLKKVVFASSYLIYDKTQYLFPSQPKNPAKLSEESSIQPRNLTGAAKLNHEIELDFISHFKSNIQTINTRIYRSYGRGSRDVISRWVRAAINNQSIKVYQSENMFDFIYAGDVALGLMKLAETKYSGVVNLASGNAKSIADVQHILSKNFPRLEAKFGKNKGEFEASEADISLLKKLTNWTPQTTLATGIRKIIKYEQKVNLEEDQRINILITSLSKKIPLVTSVRNSLKRLGVRGQIFGGDLNKNVLGSHFVDKYWRMPKTVDENLSKIINYCDQQNINLIIPTRDGELDFWSRHKVSLKRKGINVMVSEKRTTEIMLDKLKFYTKNKSKNLGIIETSNDIDQISTKKYVVKERHGAGSKSLGLNLNETSAAKHAKSLSSPIFQPFIKGKEYSVDAYINSKGELVGMIVRHRQLVINGESQITKVVNLPKVQKFIEKFINSFSFSGHIVIQLLIDDSNRMHIIECNPRFGGASTLSVVAGLKTFEWLIRETWGEQISKKEFLPSYGLKQVRYPQDKYLYEK